MDAVNTTVEKLMRQCLELFKDQMARLPPAEQNQSLHQLATKLNLICQAYRNAHQELEGSRREVINANRELMDKNASLQDASMALRGEYAKLEENYWKLKEKSDLDGEARRVSEGEYATLEERYQKLLREKQTASDGSRRVVKQLMEKNAAQLKETTSSLHNARKVAEAKVVALGEVCRKLKQERDSMEEALQVERQERDEEIERLHEQLKQMRLQLASQAASADQWVLI